MAGHIPHKQPGAQHLARGPLASGTPVIGSVLAKPLLRRAEDVLLTYSGYFLALREQRRATGHGLVKPRGLGQPWVAAQVRLAGLNRTGQANG